MDVFSFFVDLLLQFIWIIRGITGGTINFQCSLLSRAEIGLKLKWMLVSLHLKVIEQIVVKCETLIIFLIENLIS